MRYLHTMIRVRNLPDELAFYCGLPDMDEVDRLENDTDRFTLVLLAAPCVDLAPQEPWP
jgi:lactoylglutathione lyase